MQYTIDLSEDETYIILKYVGSITRQTAIKASEESHALGRKMAIRRYLVDALEARNTENLLDNYAFAYEDLKQAEIDRGACIALLVNPQDDSHDFIETLLRNAGHDVTLFKNRDQAIHHLLKGL